MRKKYEFTGETKESRGRTLHRIRAVVSFAYIKEGELGGWIETENNLSHDGDAWVYGDAQVYGNARVYGNAKIYCDARVYDNAEVHGNAKVYDHALVYGNAWVYGDAQVYDDAWVYGDAWVFRSAWVSGSARVYGNARVYGDARVSGDAEIYDNARVYGNAEVYGNAKVGSSADYAVFKNCWSSRRWFTYTLSNKKWKVGCFHGTGEELIEKAYADSEKSGRCYEAIVRAMEAIEAAMKDTAAENHPGGVHP